MPELPEVETIINQLKNKLVGRKLDVVKIFDSKLGTKKKVFNPIQPSNHHYHPQR